MTKIIPIEKTTDAQLGTCAKHCGFDDIPQFAAVMYNDPYSSIDRKVLIAGLAKRGYRKVDITDPDCVMPIRADATDKQSLTAKRDTLAAERGMKPMTGKITKRKLEDAITELENPAGDPRIPVKASTADLLKRLNVTLKKQGKPIIKTWKASRDALVQRIAKTELDTKHIKAKQIPTKIADGAETSRFHTKLHGNKVEQAVQKMDRKTVREKRKAMKTKATRLATEFGFSPKNVMLYLETVTNPLSRDVSAKDIKDFFIKRDKALKAARPTKLERAAARQPRVPGAPRPEGEWLTPADVAEACGKEPRAVRIILRKREDNIPRAWRVEGVRWGFDKKRKADIVKFINGDK